MININESVIEINELMIEINISMVQIKKSMIKINESMIINHNESMIELTVWRLWVCGISVCLMPKFEMSLSSFCVYRISALDECLLDNCVKNVRVLNA